MSDQLTAYALEHLNRGETVYTAGDVTVTATKERNDPTGEPVRELKIQLLISGSCFYLPYPADLPPDDIAVIIEGDDTTIEVPSDLHTKTFTELKAIAGGLGLSKAGGADALIARIEEHLET